MRLPLTLAAVLVCGLWPSTAAAVTTVPTGTTCSALGFGNQQFTITAPVDGTYSVDAQNSLTFRYYDNTRTIFYFTNSSLRMKGVLVAAGDRTAAWGIPSATGWPSLHAPLDSATATIPVPDSVTFCYDYELFLKPNGYAHYGQQQSWSISKTGSVSSLLLAPGQTYMAEYQVQVTPVSSSEAGFSIAGPVFAYNRSPQAIELQQLTVMVGDLAADVVCPAGLPATLAPFSVLTCEFSVAVPDTADRVVYVDAMATGGLVVTRSVETASFASHTTSTDEIDWCVKVFDDKVPYWGNFLGTGCVAEGPKTFTYSMKIGPYDACSTSSVVNTAWFEGIDTGATGQARWTVRAQVPCASSCTLSPGYFKTHSAFGPAPYDDVWTLLPSGESTPFFLSGLSYYAALWRPVGGNAYWTLARAYIAAQLNQLNGADFTAVQSAFNNATALLLANTPAQVDGSRTLKQSFVRLASVLDEYNNGLIGPGHCSQ